MKIKILIIGKYNSNVFGIRQKLDDFFGDKIIIDMLDDKLKFKFQKDIKEIYKYKFIITCTSVKGIFPNYIKPRNQVKIELTHGIFVKAPNDEYRNIDGDIDYIISPCLYMKTLLEKFNYTDSNIIVSNMPRMSYYKSLDLSLLRKKFNNYIKLEKKIVLFAPTWIPTKEILKINIQKIVDSIGKNEILVISPHQLTKKETGVKIPNNIQYYWESKSNVFFIPDEFTGEQLMLISDRLITDFSSIIFDFYNYKIYDNPLERIDFFFPDESNQDHEIVIEEYKKFYGWWGKNSTHPIDRNNPLKDFDKLFRYSDKDPAIEIINIISKAI